MANTFREVTLTCLLIGIVTTLTMAQQQDLKGSKDHPLISRYPGSFIKEYSQKDFDEFPLPLGKLTKGKFEKSQQLGGKVTRILYQAPAGRSVLEVFRNYEGALKQAGFETLFTCAKEACGYGPVTLYGGKLENWSLTYDPHYLSAKLTRPGGGDVYVSLYAGASSWQWETLYVVEMKPMQAGLVTVDAAALAGDISRTGHAAVYGIYFDTGKADVKPESGPALAQITKLLEKDPQLKLHVVGHTDAVGSLPSNMDLSRRRADAVVKLLTTKYQIAATRLNSQGVGPLAPVASNESEDGRAKNRRVELVKQ
jgi:flagellar motor protein MotB